MVKGEMNPYTIIFVNNFFSFQKNLKNKLNLNRNFKNVTKRIPTVFVYYSLSIIYKKVTLKKYFPLYRLPGLPVNSIFFTDLPVNLKPGKSSTLKVTLSNLV
jgi:hypothetical protein